MVWSQVAKGEVEIKRASNDVNKRYQRAETTWYCSYVAVSVASSITRKTSGQ